MTARNCIFVSLRLVATLAIVWGVVAFISPANAHQFDADTPLEIVSNNSIDVAMSEHGSNDQEADHRHCHSAGSLCHAFATISLSHSHLIPLKGGPAAAPSPSLPRNRAIPPLYRPPISA